MTSYETGRPRKLPLWYKNLGHISYTGRVIANFVFKYPPVMVIHFTDSLSPLLYVPYPNNFGTHRLNISVIHVYAIVSVNFLRTTEWHRKCWCNVRKKIKNWVLSPNFFQGEPNQIDWRLSIADEPTSCDNWQCFEKIGAETAEKECPEKHNAKYSGRSVTQKATIIKLKQKLFYLSFISVLFHMCVRRYDGSSLTM